jgi:hypothetical protein
LGRGGIWLGATRRVNALGTVLGLTAVALGIAAAGAFELSSVRYSPNRDMPLISSGFFLTFSFGAFVSGPVALALLAPLIRGTKSGRRARLSSHP